MGTVYLPRSAWTSTARGGAKQTGADLVGLVVHYTGVHRTYGALSRAVTARVLRGMRRYHVGTRGWTDIGYTVCVDQIGRVWDLRGITRVPAAHASASNPRANWHRSAVLCLLGVDEQPTDEMIEACQDFRTERWLGRWPGADDLLGHRDVPGASTRCPDDALAALVADGTLLGRPGSSGGSGGGGSTRPAPGPEVDFPLPAGHYFGPREWGNRSVSGYYGRIFRGRPDYAWLQEWVSQLERRGWPVGRGRRYLGTYGSDGRYGPEHAELIRAFQRDQGLTDDELLGAKTWRAAYRNPVT